MRSLPPFIRATAKISTAASLAQGLALLAAPLLTRIYSPAEFGSFAVLNAISLVLAAGIGLRLEFAVPLPPSSADAGGLARIGLTTAVATGVLATVVGVLLGGPLQRVFSIDAPAWTFGLIGPLAISYASFGMLGAVAVRDRRFGAIARRYLLAGAGMVSLQIVGGFLDAGTLGLVLAAVVAQGLGSLSLLIGADTPIRRTSGGANDPRALLRRYKKFPLLLAPAGLLNTAAYHGQVVVLGLYFGANVAGWYGLVVRVVGAPLALIGEAVAHVYTAELAADKRGLVGTHRQLFLSVSMWLAIIGVAVGLVLAALARLVFPAVFGSEWAMAGAMAQAFSLAAAFQIVSAPLSQTLIVFERIRTQIALDAATVLLTLGTPAIAATLGWSAVSTVWAMSIEIALISIVNWALCFHAVSAPSSGSMSPDEALRSSTRGGPKK